MLDRTSPGDRVLDCGTSTGYVTRRFVAAGRRVDGGGLDPVAAEAAHGVCDFVWVGDLSESTPPNSPRLRPDPVRRHARAPAPPRPSSGDRRGVSPPAGLVVSLPNVANWAIGLSLLGGQLRYTERGILDRTHLRFYTRNTARRMIEASGFTVTGAVGSIPVPFVRSRALGRVAHRIGNLRPSLFAYTFVITAEAAA